MHLKLGVFMKKYHLLALGLLAISISACGSSEEASSSTSSMMDSSISLSSESINSSIDESSSSEFSSETSTSIESSYQSEQFSESSQEETSSESSESSSSEECPFESISLNKRSLVLVVGKKDDLVVNFEPDTEDVDLKDGTWESSDNSVATVRYGRVTAVKKGTAVISFTTTLGNLKAYCTVTVVNSEDEIIKEFVKVDDMDSIKLGDELIFACPEFGVAASLNRYDRYLLPSSASFTHDGNKLISFDEDVARFYVGEGIDDAFTLENQNNEYLAGKLTQRDTSLSFVKSKGQINWIFERAENTGLDYCVNYDIADDLWLMFNKISDGDIRFNLYDSNVTTLMKLPTIYRYTITAIS